MVCEGEEVCVCVNNLSSLFISIKKKEYIELLQVVCACYLSLSQTFVAVVNKTPEKGLRYLHIFRGSASISLPEEIGP